VRARSIEGGVSDGIVDFASRTECDLIVMGTHGRTGIKRAVLGSVAESVVRRAECPVLTVKADKASGASREGGAASPAAT
jgi:nucleotide-binding universal stress UspA family protein